MDRIVAMKKPKLTGQEIIWYIESNCPIFCYYAPTFWVAPFIAENNVIKWNLFDEENDDFFATFKSKYAAVAEAQRIYAARYEKPEDCE
jgi:hypothetical protein